MTVTLEAPASGVEARTRAAVRSIVEALAEFRPAGERWSGLSEKEGYNWYTLSHGSAGVALAMATVGRWLADERLCAAGRDYLNEAISLIAAQQTGESLYCGYTGVAMAASLMAELDGYDAGEAFDAIDEALARKLDRAQWATYYDIVYGLAGMGSYALQRRNAALATRIVRHLQTLAIDRDGGATLLTLPRQVSPIARGPMAISRDTVPNGFYDLGLAHGVPGVICFLSALYELDPHAETAALLARLVGWMRAQRESGGPWPYPSWVTPEGYRQRGKLAWCYGPLGVALALDRAGRALGRAEWIAEAAEATRRCAAAADAFLTVVDEPYFCHGTSGIAMLFDLLGRGDAASLYREKSLDLVERDLHTLAPSGEDDDLRVYRTSFLSGYAGVALDLAASQGASRSWQRILVVKE